MFKMYIFLINFPECNVKIFSGIYNNNYYIKLYNFVLTNECW